MVIGYVVTIKFPINENWILAYGITKTPNEGINQRNLKIWADVADKIYFGRLPINLGVGVDFQLCSDNLLTKHQ